MPSDEWWWIENTIGLCDPIEGDWLASAASEVASGLAIVEIGSHTGQSTLWIAAGSRQGNRAPIYAVDPWPDPGYADNDDPFDFKTGDAVYARFLENIRGTTQSLPNVDYSDLVTPVRLTSEAAAHHWHMPIGLLFIDAIHTFEGVKKDCELWTPHLEEGGWLALNDFFQDPNRTAINGPGLFAKEVLEPSGDYEECDVVWNTWVGKRVKRGHGS